MPGGLAAELTKALDIFDRKRVAGEVQHSVQQHRAVAVREHEPVAVGPQRVAGVVAHELAPQHLRDIGHAHGHAGMPRVRALYGIHGQCADGVGEFAGCIHSGSQARLAAAAVGLYRGSARAALAVRQCARRGAHSPPLAPDAQIGPTQLKFPRVLSKHAGLYHIMRSGRVAMP